MVSFSLYVTLFFVSADWNNKQAVSAVKIENNRFVGRDEIIKLVEKMVINKAKSSINLLQIEDLVDAHPFVEYSYAYFLDNKTIGISIKERVPIAFIKLEVGDLDYIDRFGKIIPNRALPEYSDMPILIGFTEQDFKDSSLVGQVRDVLSSLGDNDFVYNLISEISYNKSNKNFEFFTTDRNLKVLFGRLEDIHEKYHKLVIFWKEWVSKNNTSQVKYIDLRWKNRVVLV